MYLDWAIRAGADKIAFGVPADDLPRIHLSARPEAWEHPALADFRKEQDERLREARTAVAAGDDSLVDRLPANIIYQLEDGVVPIWLRIAGKWHEWGEGIHCRLLTGLPDVVDFDLFCIHPQQKVLERRFLKVWQNLLDGGPDFVEARLVLEKNCCWSIEILGKPIEGGASAMTNEK